MFVIIFRTLHPDELDAWFDHCARAFDVWSSRQYFVNHWHNDPWRDLATVFVAVDGSDGQERIVSTVRVFARTMVLRGEDVPAGCLGEVSTHPDYRRRGLSTHLLRESLAWMRDHGIAISALGTGISPFYARLGWQSVPLTSSAVDTVAATDPRYDFRPLDLTDAHDIATAAQLHADLSRRFNGPFRRDHPGYWSHWMQAEAAPLWLVSQGGEALAYIALREMEGRRLTVVDYGAVALTRDLFAAALRHAVGQLNLPAATVWFPAALAPEMPASQVDVDGGWHYRVINPDLLPGRGDIPLADLLCAQRPDLQTAAPSHHLVWGADDY
jgi:predicted N-acetyltransferase YhbS